MMRMTTRTRRRSPALARDHHPHSPPPVRPTLPTPPPLSLLLFFTLSFFHCSFFLPLGAPPSHVAPPTRSPRLRSVLPYFILFYFILFYFILFFSTSLISSFLTVMYSPPSNLSTHIPYTFYPSPTYLPTYLHHSPLYLLYLPPPTRATTPTTHLTSPPVRHAGIHHSAPAPAACGH
jgi:hypothetical protein